ncbi:MAG: GNAT family N-acetyltransferase [Roseiflexaceae bacterium]|nr:GNAT family N-acetyltransferase [Roseiflexaceae bacterium]
MSTNDSLTIRSAETSAELDAFFRLACEGFALDTLRSVAYWQQRVERAPDYVPGQVRCAFVANTVIGGYILYERRLRVGFVTIPTGCFAHLVTHPDWRGRGVATALMHDAIARAIERRLGLILLDGIAGFYGRFGYVDILDTTRHIVSRSHLAAMPLSPYTARPATPADAPVLLELYERHYAGYSGSFVRSIAWQRHDLALRLEENPPRLACDARGQVRGYLILPSRAPSNHAVEAAADDWHAALALLQHHASIAREAAEIDWPLPPNSPTFYTLADHLNLTSRSHHHPDEGWMARPAHLPTLLTCIGPLLEERRRATGGEAFRLCIAGAEPSLAVGADANAPDLPTVTLTLQALVQLLFGFRPAHWVARYPGVHVPPAMLPTLGAIFPTGRTWIAGSDAF